MTDNVTQLGTEHIKKSTIPDLIAQMEQADTTIVIHIKGGRWSLTHIKGTTTIWSLMGLLQLISTHFANIANGAQL